VWDALPKEIPTVARMTLYNTLKPLVEKGLLTVLTIKSEETCYDYKPPLCA